MKKILISLAIVSLLIPSLVFAEPFPWECQEGTYYSEETEQCEQHVLGCTDSKALNYNSKATENNGSCIAKVYGCT
ncbi:hypothetical protein LCGC14_1564710, partial [marine sediment metagenome]